ncbi:hypothetical protein AU210_002983 [Fusarium oxysporum f. sp. radicis-cucumerinum]|uniref:Uncharacterized protein n=1 Tax=Fusarium oxysporum f. sp. radicis-cucumerinum TaxID=327505 RepID=A0A2H3HPC9_FUSOX|nr:hypothetical protein AU210_002983 [Fusarium oxysporum f. sp. radicis-cucumerinum]
MSAWSSFLAGVAAAADILPLCVPCEPSHRICLVTEDPVNSSKPDAEASKLTPIPRLAMFLSCHDNLSYRHRLM